MSVRDLGTRYASATVRDSLSRMGRGHAPSITVHRRELPYWQEHDWKHEGSRYTGSYQTPYGSFYGQIDEHRGGHIDFFIYSPSDEIRSHNHFVCFQHRGNDWYLVHMSKQAHDASSGILTIERLITDAYES